MNKGDPPKQVKLGNYTLTLTYTGRNTFLPLQPKGGVATSTRFVDPEASMTTPLEAAESLEQLRALEHGFKIAVFVSRYAGREVNTAADYEAFVSRERRRQHVS